MSDQRDKRAVEESGAEPHHRRRRKPLLRRNGASWLKLLEPAAHLSAVAALVGLFLQLSADARNRRAEATLAYVQSYNSEPISSHRQRLDRIWLERRPEVALLNQTGGLTRAGLDRLVRFTLAQADAKAGPGATPIALSVQELASFYDQVAICVEQNLCDEGIVKPYFYRNMHAFWTYYQATVREMRPAVSDEFGASLERLVGRME